MEIKNCVAIITGGASGMGAATARLLSQQGAKIVLFDLNKEAGTTLLLVTHDSELAARTQRIISLKGGKIMSDKPTTAKV